MGMVLLSHYLPTGGEITHSVFDRITLLNPVIAALRAKTVELLRRTQQV
jgi:hypothetical protein